MSKFKVGRKDCSPNGVEDDAAEEFPSNNMENIVEIHEYFNKQFDFTLQESVAIMGAHSLGMKLVYIISASTHDVVPTSTRTTRATSCACWDNHHHHHLCTHTTLFQSLYNVHNVGTTSYER